MKLLREKIFFDYKGYAEKYGEDAANRMRSSRSELANKIKSKRLDSKNKHTSPIQNLVVLLARSQKIVSLRRKIESGSKA